MSASTEVWQRTITGINRASPQAKDLALCLPAMSGFVQDVGYNTWRDPQNNGIAATLRINYSEWRVDPDHGRMAYFTGSALGGDRGLVYKNGGNIPALISNNFTIAFWFKPAVLTQTNRYVITRPSNRWAVIWEYVNNTLEWFGTYTGSDPRPASDIVISDTNVHHIAYCYDGTTWAGYRDGQQVFSTALTFSVSDIAGPIVLAASTTGGSNEFNGSLDDVRIYTRGKSAAEIQQLYADPWDLYRPQRRVWYVAAGTAPAAPSDLAATAVSSSQINLTWTDNSADETGFELQRDTAATFDSPATLIEPAANATSYSDTGLTASTLYYYRIRAVNAFGNSAYSATVSATTDAAATALPVLMGGGLFGGLQSISGGLN